MLGPGRTKTLLEGSIKKLELDALEDHLQEVAKNRDDARTMCTADVIREATKNEDSESRRSTIRKSLEWEEELRQIKRVLYSCRNLNRLIPFYGVARDISAYVALIHLRALYIPFLSSVELRKRVHDGRGTNVYLSFINPSGGIALIAKIPLVLKKEKMDAAHPAVMRMSPLKQSTRREPTSMGLTFVLDLRIPFPVELQGRPPARTSSFNLAVQMDYQTGSYCARQAVLKGTVVRAGVAPHKQAYNSLARRSRPVREIQQVKLVANGPSNKANIVTLDLTVTEIVHSCAVGGRLAHPNVPNSIRGRIKELFQSTRKSHMRCLISNDHHDVSPLSSLLNNAETIVQVHPTAQCEPMRTKSIPSLFTKGINMIVLRSLDATSLTSNESYVGKSKDFIFNKVTAHSEKRCTASTIT